MECDHYRHQKPFVGQGRKNSAKNTQNGLVIKGATVELSGNVTIEDPVKFQCLQGPTLYGMISLNIDVFRIICKYS